MWRFKAFILTKLDRREEALAAFNKALMLNPSDIYNWQYKASLLVEMKMYNEFFEAYDKTPG
jgi:tetratricopeptide (TPR) repeat protein